MGIKVFTSDLKFDKALPGGGGPGATTHTDLTDMPSAVVADHDGRYYTETECGTLFVAKAVVTEQGDIIYATAPSVLAALPHGTVGQALLSGGHGANPYYGAPAPAAHEIDGALHTATSGLSVAKGGTGFKTVTIDSYLKGNGTNALAPRTYSEVRTDLGLIIGTNVQAYSADIAFRTDKLSAFAATTSAELLGVISNETGSGLLVFGTSPTIVTPTIASFLNANHTHAAAGASGGLVDPIHGQNVTTTTPEGAADEVLIYDNSAGAIRKMLLDNFVRGTRTIALMAGSGDPTTTIGCAAVAKVEAATNDIDYLVLDFDTTTEERAFWNITLPDSYNGGTLIARFTWTCAGGSAAQTVRWGIKALCLADDGAIDTAYGSEVTVDDTWIANGDVHISSVSAAITPSGTLAGGNTLIVNVGRKVANDNLAGDARLISVLLEYGINKWSD